MTTKQTHLRKLFNALHRVAGRYHVTTKGVQWVRAPQPKSLPDVERWLWRCKERGYLPSSFTVESFMTQNGVNLSLKPFQKLFT